MTLPEPEEVTVGTHQGFFFAIRELSENAMHASEDKPREPDRGEAPAVALALGTPPAGLSGAPIWSLVDHRWP